MTIYLLLCAETYEGVDRSFVEAAYESRRDADHEAAVKNDIRKIACPNDPRRTTWDVEEIDVILTRRDP